MELSKKVLGAIRANSMCCARTAVLQEGTKSRSKCQFGFPAAINAFVRPNEHDSTKKQRPGRSKTLFGEAQPLKNRAWSAPKRHKNSHKHQQNAARAAKRVKEPSKSEKKANMAPTCGVFDLDSGGADPHQGRKCSMLMQA